MKVVLATLNAKYIHSSLALRYLRAFVQTDFPNVHIREYTIKEPANHIVADLFQQQPALIGFSVYIWNVVETLEILNLLKKVLPDTVLVLGGPEVSYDTRDWMMHNSSIDYIIQGEGEIPFYALLDALRGNRVIADVPGIAYRLGSKIQINSPAAKPNLADIPSAYLNEPDLAELRNRIVYFETSRGCPFACQFCLSSIETGVRYFPMERVKRELRLLLDSGIRTVKFVDRTFNLNRAYALELFQFLIDNRANTVFQFEITGDILPREIVDFLGDTAPPGLFRFEIGVQSTNDRVNVIVQRRQNFERLRETIRSLQATEKIVLHLDLIAGLPEEDYPSFRTTFNDVFGFEADELQLGFLKMLRGTGLRQRAAEHGYVFMDRAPYEVLYNEVLPYADVLRIKQVEDVLEKYWNEGKVKYTVRFLTKHVFATPFDFFQGFGSFWETQGWSRIGHQLVDLFLRLDAYLTVAASQEHRAIARCYMKYDFLLVHRVRPNKLWWEPEFTRSAQAQLTDSMTRHPDRFGENFARVGFTQAQLAKHAAFAHVSWRIRPDDPSALPEPEPNLLIFYYQPGLEAGQRPTVFSTPLEGLGAL